MNDTLRQQLKHPQARIRHQAIVKLARMKDDEVLPLLNDIAKNDPEPSLREMAERAITHILNEYSSTMSKLQRQEAPPSDIPPFSNPKAEQHMQTAFKLQENGAKANALQYLIKALDLAPLLAQDPDVQRLAGNLTGTDGATAAMMLADRDQRQKFFDNDLPNDNSGNFPNSPSMWIIFFLFLVIMGKFFWSDGVQIINRAFDELEVQQIKRSARQVNGVDYYLVTPEGASPQNGYPLLVTIPDGQEDATAMLAYFSAMANQQGAILLVPEFRDYRFASVRQQSEALNSMLSDVSREYKINSDGAVLFGFGDGAMVATHHASIFPDHIAGVVTSGGTFLYPPTTDIPYTYIYGVHDALLRDVTDNEVPFAEIADWSSPLNYLTIDNIGHEINNQQVDITAQVLRDLYQ